MKTIGIIGPTAMSHGESVQNQNRGSFTGLIFNPVQLVTKRLKTYFPSNHLKSNGFWWRKNYLIFFELNTRLPRLI